MGEASGQCSSPLPRHLEFDRPKPALRELTENPSSLFTVNQTTDLGLVVPRSTCLISRHMCRLAARTSFLWYSAVPVSRTILNASQAYVLRTPNRSLALLNDQVLQMFKSPKGK